MKRRSFLTAFGASVGATGLTLGSGAFTTVSAERTISVRVADDFRAFLRLEPIPNEGIHGEITERSSTAGRVVSFEIPGDGDGENTNSGGVAADSVYEFHNLLQVINQGTQSVRVYSTYDGSLTDIALVNKNGVLRNNPPALAVGDTTNVGLQLDTHNSVPGEYDEDITIVAERVGGNRD